MNVVSATGGITIEEDSFVGFKGLSKVAIAETKQDPGMEESIGIEKVVIKKIGFNVIGCLM